MRTPYFWVLVAGTATSALLCTAVIFHQISLLGERGLTPTQAAATFLPMTAAGIVATMAVGYAVDRLFELLDTILEPGRHLHQP